MTPPVVVIGVGNEYRGDDGIGPAVAAEIERRALPGVRTVVADGEPAALIEAWADAERAIVVDAVLCEPSDPGRIWRSTVDNLPNGTGVASSHALGIPEALLLGKALGRVPGELVVIAVEAEDLGLRAGLTSPLSKALPRVVEVVLRECDRPRST